MNNEINRVMEKLGINDGDLLTHWEASQQLSHHSSDKKLNAIPQDKREAIGNFYSALRRQGIYPTGTKNWEMRYSQSPTPTEKYKEIQRISKNNCAWDDCKSCRVMTYPESENCETRTREWIAGIENILAVTVRPPGEGKQLAEELIIHMRDNFMGGIK